MKNNKSGVALVYPESGGSCQGLRGHSGERWGARRWLWAIDNEFIQCLIGGQCRYSSSDLETTFQRHHRITNSRSFYYVVELES